MNQSKPDTKDQLHRHLVELKEQVAQLETQQGNQSAKSAGEIIEAVLERMPIGVLVVGKNRIIRKANACAMKIFGVSESQIVGKHCRQVMEHQDDHRCPIWDMERSIDHWEKHVVNNGKKNTFMKTAFPVTWAGEQMLLEFLIDITAEKKAEAQLRKQRENRRKTGQIKVQQALYQISNAVHTTKNLTDLFEVIQVELGRIIDTNNFFIALYDKQTDTISLPYLKDEKDKFKTYPAGKTLTAYVINSGKALLANRTAIDQLVELGAIESVGTDCEVWLGCPLRIEEKIIGVVALQSYTDPNAYSCNDLEMLNFASEQIGLSIERKQTEDNLRSLTAMIEQSTDSIIQTDTDFRIIYINDAACKLFGWTFEEIKGKSPVVFYAPADHAKQDKENRPIQKNTVALSPGESIYRKKDGSLFCGQFKVSPLTDQNGNIYGYMGIIQDISQRKKSQEDRVQLEEQLLHAQKMEAVGNLAGGIAHDFNNILGVIMGYTQLTVDNISDVPRAQYNLEKIMIAADRAKEVVKQVLTFSRKEEKDLRPLYIANVLQETLSLLRASLPATIEIRREIRKGLKPVMANFTQIHQVVMNICTNAAHAMKENGGVLAIDLKEAILDDRTVAGKELEPGKYQQLTFSDTGNGMLPVVMRRIFEPYYTTKKKGEGTGLGLAVVHGIVKSHGGDISVESEPGKGTVFHLFLPETEDEWVTKKKSPGTIPGGNERILLVDDEILLVDMESHMLSRLGYRVAAHTGSHEALEDFRNHPHQFDLVITDQTMPNMTGLQLSSQLKRIRSDIPIILCTGFSEVINEKNFKTRGIDGFIMKPILKKKLAQLIRSLLDART